MRNKIRTKTPNIPRLPIDKISNTPTSLNNNSQKRIINLKNIQKKKESDTDGAVVQGLAQKIAPTTDPMVQNCENAAPPSIREGRAEKQVEETGTIDVNMFRQHSSPSPSQDDLHENLQGDAEVSNEKVPGRVDGEMRAADEQSLDAPDEVVTNPVLVGAMQQTSKFDEQYEHDMDGANVTLEIKTDRLRQFPEAYDMLQHISNPDDRILMKQQVIFQYEPLLRKQIKAERKKKKKEKQRQMQEMQ
jgi:hypothetical protein